MRERERELVLACSSTVLHPLTKTIVSSEKSPTILSVNMNKLTDNTSDVMLVDHFQIKSDT